jgi:multidrug resistance efflux pump
MRARMSLDEARNEQDVENLRVRWLEARVELATARVSLENARRDLERASRLFAEKIVSEAEYDAAQSLHDALQVEVQERSTLVEGLDQTVRRLVTSNERDRGGASRSQPVPYRPGTPAEGAREVNLRAPMDGMVKMIAGTEGERARRRHRAVVTDPQAQRIIGYVRQPSPSAPDPACPSRSAPAASPPRSANRTSPASASTSNS